MADRPDQPGCRPAPAKASAANVNTRPAAFGAVLVLPVFSSARIRLMSAAGTGSGTLPAAVTFASRAASRLRAAVATARASPSTSAGAVPPSTAASASRKAASTIPTRCSRDAVAIEGIQSATRRTGTPPAFVAAGR